MRVSRLLLALLLLAPVGRLHAQEAAIITASPSHAGYLFDHESLSSLNAQYMLVMQRDGNLVLYDAGCGRSSQCAVWNSGSYREEGQYYMAIQPDGNLVIYTGRPPSATDRHIWSSQTSGDPDSYFLAVQDDGNLVIYRGTSMANRSAVWSSRTGKIGG